MAGIYTIKLQGKVQNRVFLAAFTEEFNFWATMSPRYYGLCVFPRKQYSYWPFLFICISDFVNFSKIFLVGKNSMKSIIINPIATMLKELLPQYI